MIAQAVRSPVCLWLLIISALLGLVGCSSGSYAPVSERSLGSSGSQKVQSIRASGSIENGTYRVKKGDTLYSIAFRYGKDFKTLARINGIGSHYRIYPGQKLRLSTAPSAASKTAGVTTESASQTSDSKAGGSKASDSGSVVSNAVPVTTGSKSASQSNTRSSRSALEAKNASSNNVASANVSRASSSAMSEPSSVSVDGTGKNSTAVLSASVANVKKSETSADKKRQKIVWQWPANGKVIQYYQAKGKLNKGLNIAARVGEPVHAAASGSVVYAGSGLLGYGNLIIIKHDQHYLSAYAHNSKIFVKEKDEVRIGEKIALAGDSGTTRSMLHFEIRKEGKPVNPLKYLPKRK